MKKILLFLIFTFATITAQMPQFGEAKGLFLSAGVGPKIPIGSFSETSNPGGGFDVSLSYTDNLFFPLFLNLSAGYIHFPGSQSFYSVSDYSSFSTNVITASLGARYYFSPIMNNIVLLMPVAEISLLYADFNDYHQFKTDTAKKSYNDNYGKFGFQAGAGVSMFMFEIMGYYNIIQGHNFLSFDLRARIPIFVSM
jgi:hypothetical protein